METLPGGRLAWRMPPGGFARFPADSPLPAVVAAGRGGFAIARGSRLRRDLSQWHWPRLCQLNESTGTG